MNALKKLQIFLKIKLLFCIIFDEIEEIKVSNELHRNKFKNIISQAA